MTNAYGEDPYNQQSFQNPTVTSPPFQTASPPMPYGQPYGAPPREHPRGTLILVFGILGAFVTIFAPIAWYLGSKAKQEIQASGLQYTDEPNVNAGRILGKVFSIIWLVFFGIMILAFAVRSSLEREVPANPGSSAATTAAGEPCRRPAALSGSDKEQC